MVGKKPITLVPIKTFRGENIKHFVTVCISYNTFQLHLKYKQSIEQSCKKYHVEERKIVHDQRALCAKDIVEKSTWSIRRVKTPNNSD